MKLETFKALVDTAPPAPSKLQLGARSKALLAEIQNCFTARESDQARTDVRAVIDDVGLRLFCDQAASEPYLGVAIALQLALRERGDSQSPTSDWQKAATLGLLYATMFPSGLPADQQWKTNVKVSTLTAALKGLREKGYQVDLPATGGLDVPDETTTKLAADIASLCTSLGHGLATSAANAIAGKYSHELGRFNLGRPGQTVQIDAQPELPLAYLYQLGLRYISLLPTASNPQAALNELFELVRFATALLDLTSTVNDTLFAREPDVLGILQRSVVYDAVFLVTQAKPSHTREYLSWMMTHEKLANLKGKGGVTSNKVHRLAMMLLEACESAHPRDFSTVDAKDAAKALGTSDIALARKMLITVFAHSKGANQMLTFPPKDTDVDAAFRPLLVAHEKIWMQPGPVAARAVVNAALDWCKQAWPNKEGFDDEALGPMFELFVRAKLTAHGVQVHHGNYTHGPATGECDAVVETHKALIFMELKTKMLTRAARAGDDITALFDLAQALVRPQAQAMERHAVIRENGVLKLTADGQSYELELGGREVLRISVTRGDLGSLHDRAFLQQFLRLGCVTTFQAIDATRQDKLSDLHTYFGKLKSAADRGQEPYIGTKFPFERTWSLSVFHLLMLLERTTDSESFSRELQRTRRVITPMKDFYAEYAYMLKLEKCSQV